MVSRESNDEARDAILRFLSGALALRKERYLEFASRPKAQGKLLADFYHHFASCFAKQAVVQQLPSEAWSSVAYSFAPPREFGVRWTTLREGYDNMGEAQLLVTADGKFGIHTQEDSFGGAMFIRSSR